MDIVKEALEFEQQKLVLRTTSDRILVARKVKSLILGINEIYKQTKDDSLMELMKRLTAIKRKVEKRLNFNAQTIA